MRYLVGPQLFGAMGLAVSHGKVCAPGGGLAPFLLLDWQSDLMSVDKYSVCPCGTGKKIKFCCKESVSELDAVLSMVEGGQVVPALDQLSSILQEHPNAAWALAIRGRLLLDLREYDSLSENAERFIRLQPSNPLALTQRAAANLFHGEVEDATASMLEALTESGSDVDSFVLDVSSVLAYSLAQRGTFLTARVYATLSMMATGYEGGQASVSVLRQMNSAPTISQLMKTVPQPIGRPNDAQWGERYDEAANLLRSNKIDLAESKFESLRRTVPKEPAILSGLLTCAIWRGNTDAQSELLKKLSECESLDFEERVRNRAMSALVDPTSAEISIPIMKMYADLDNPEQIEMSLMASSRFVSLPPDLLAGMRTTEDEVPPRCGFQMLDRDKPDSLEILPPIDEVPEAIALVFVYGKQTDREARLEILDVRKPLLSQVKEGVQDAVGDLDLTELKGELLPMLVACQPAVAMIRFQAKPAEAEKLQNGLMAERMPKAIASIETPMLDGGSLASTCDDESKLFERTVMMRIVEQYDALVAKGQGIIDEAYRIAKLEPQPMIKAASGDVETIANEDLNRIDCSDLDAESLIYLLQRAQQVSATPTVRRVAKQLIGTELAEEQKPAKMLAYMTLINAAEGNEQAIELMDEAKAFAEANNIPTANLLLSEVGLRLSAGDGPGFQNAVETLSRQYGNEPEVMAKLQQTLMAYGLISPDGTPRQAPGAPGPAAEQGGGGGELWTPESGAPAPESGGGGGGKLWVPGMD
jgi:tetratricopeptide (TPR) repeat protein